MPPPPAAASLTTTGNVAPNAIPAGTSVRNDSSSLVSFIPANVIPIAEITFRNSPGMALTPRPPSTTKSATAPCTSASRRTGGSNRSARRPMTIDPTAIPSRNIESIALNE